MGKKNDCVRMKREIQEDLLKENLGVSDEKLHESQSNKISKNTTLAKFLEKVKIEKNRISV